MREPPTTSDITRLVVSLLCGWVVFVTSLLALWLEHRTLGTNSLLAFAFAPSSVGLLLSCGAAAGLAASIAWLLMRGARADWPPLPVLAISIAMTTLSSIVVAMGLAMLQR